jgi:hypothetical protein
MLNKELCKKCMYYFVDEQIGKENRMNKQIDEEYNEDVIYCMGHIKVIGDLFNRKLLKNLNEPPDSCPYILEHLVSDKNAK